MLGGVRTLEGFVMTIINAIRLLLKKGIITPRQAANMAIRYLNSNESEETASAKRKIPEVEPFVCPTCRQEILPF